MRKTFFSLEVVGDERLGLVPVSEEEIILLFCRSFVEHYNADLYTYNVFVRDFFDSVSYYQISRDNLQCTIGTLKKVFHKSYNIIMQIERISSYVFVSSFDIDEAKALVGRFNKETLRHWVLSKFRDSALTKGKRQLWENRDYLPLYRGLSKLAESHGLFEDGRSKIEEFLLAMNCDGNPPPLHIKPEMTSHVAVFLGMLKHYKLIHGRYQKIIQDKGCLIGAEGNPISSSTLSSAKHLYWYRFEDGDDLVQNQDTPVDSLIASFRAVYNDFNVKSLEN